MVEEISFLEHLKHLIVVCYYTVTCITLYINVNALNENLHNSAGNWAWASSLKIMWWEGLARVSSPPSSSLNIVETILERMENHLESRGAPGEQEMNGQEAGGVFSR